MTILTNLLRNLIEKLFNYFAKFVQKGTGKGEHRKLYVFLRQNTQFFKTIFFVKNKNR